MKKSAAAKAKKSSKAAPAKAGRRFSPARQAKREARLKVVRALGSVSGEEKLTYAELRVLQYLLRGYQHNEIAEALGRSSFTISNHARKIYEAFGVTSHPKLMATILLPKLPPTLAEAIGSDDVDYPSELGRPDDGETD